MKAKAILLPVDFSHSSDAALKFASSLAAESGGVLHIVHVGEDSPAYLAGYGGFAYTPDLAEKIARENRELLEQVKPTVPSVKFEQHYLCGDPAQEILTFANSKNVDLIVIGSHGRTGLSRLLLGSIAEAVVRGAACPVLTVKQPVNEDSQTESSNPSQENNPQPKEHPEPKSKFSLH